jgi:hypothetical protein
MSATSTAGTQGGNGGSGWRLDMHKKGAGFIPAPFLLEPCLLYTERLSYSSVLLKY